MFFVCFTQALNSTYTQTLAQEIRAFGKRVLSISSLALLPALAGYQPYSADLNNTNLLFVFMSLFPPFPPSLLSEGVSQARKQFDDIDSAMPVHLAAVMTKQNITCESGQLNVAHAASNSLQSQPDGLLSNVAHAASDRSPSRPQLGSIQLNVAHAASNCLQPQLSSLLSTVAHAASDRSLSQSGSLSLSNVAHAASDFDGSLDSGLNQTRLQAIPETGSVKSSKDITECKHADDMSVNNEIGLSEPLLMQHIRLTHFDNKETAENEVSRGEVAVKDSCVAQVSINGEICVSEPLLTQHLRLTHFSTITKLLKKRFPGVRFC